MNKHYVVCVKNDYILKRKCRLPQVWPNFPSHMRSRALCLPAHGETEQAAVMSNTTKIDSMMLAETDFVRCMIRMI